MCLLLRGALGGRMNPLSWGHCRFLTGHLGPGSAELSRPALGQGLFLLFLSKVTAPRSGKRVSTCGVISNGLCKQATFSAVFLMGFPAPQEGEGFLAVTLGQGDTSSYPMNAALGP